METITLVFLIVMFTLSIVTSFINDYRAKKTTYEELLERSYELIDKGQYQKLRAYLSARYKLVLIHYNELIPLLTEYARKKSGDVIDDTNKEV